MDGEKNLMDWLSELIEILKKNGTKDISPADLEIYMVLYKKNATPDLASKIFDWF